AAELLAATPEASEDRIGRPLRRIERAAADMETIIESFLWLARGRVAGEPSPAPTPLAPIVERVLERHEHLLAGKPIQVGVTRRAALAVAAPPAVLEVAVGNLVANAFHFTETGSVTIEIDEESVLVADTGPGLASEEVERAARPFVRGDRSAGFGLGLDIVRSLCERFGWRLEIEGGAGTGTRARLDFTAEPTATPP
ncbi:MAG TPA: HAMP domain-containing sensor histidine kinase, partial [Kofleriaceae bacterium]|nr:HAMP domain-containing sensor histidine kinase [Kofleriaceae bacterium]